MTLRQRLMTAAQTRTHGGWLLDGVLAAGFTMVAVLLGSQPEPGPGWRAQDALGIAVTVVVNAPVTARRRAPVAVLAASCAAWALFISLGYWPVVNSMGPFLALYSVAAHRGSRPAVCATGLVGAVWVYAGWRAGQPMTACVAQAVVFPAAGCWFGIAARVSHQRADRLAELAAALEREQRDRARREVAEEQRRIARELHDVVAHHMSVINVQAGMAGYVFTTEPDTAREALGTIAGTSQEALRELRRMLTLLRSGAEDDGHPGPDGAGDADADGGAPLAPMPGLAGLTEVADRVRAAGVPVELRFSGARPLAPGVELCAYRVVQEALTNVLKHAHSARATVHVEFGARELVVRIEDTGHHDRTDSRHRDRMLSAKVPLAAPPSGGHGLIGMRERARLYGGTVDAGPRAEGGFGVRLTLPITPGVHRSDGG